MSIKKRWLMIENPKEHGPNVISVTLDYHLGGYNYLRNREEQRGYYIHITPLKLSFTDYGMKEYGAPMSPDYAGLKILVVPVKRKSKKAENQAINYFDNDLLQGTIQAWSDKTGIQFKPEFLSIREVKLKLNDIKIAS